MQEESEEIKVKSGPPRPAGTPPTSDRGIKKSEEWEIYFIKKGCRFLQPFLFVVDTTVIFSSQNHRRKLGSVF
jgi:hypothetical protein